MKTLFMTSLKFASFDEAELEYASEAIIGTVEELERNVRYMSMSCDKQEVEDDFLQNFDSAVREENRLGAIIDGYISDNCYTDEGISEHVVEDVEPHVFTGAVLDAVSKWAVQKAMGEPVAMEDVVKEHVRKARKEAAPKYLDLIKVRRALVEGVAQTVIAS